MKKPIYKRWWFWVIVAVVVIMGLPQALGETPPDAEATPPTPTVSWSNASAEPTAPETETPAETAEQTAPETETETPTAESSSAPAAVVSDEPQATGEPSSAPTPEKAKITGSSTYTFQRNSDATIAVQGEPNTDYSIVVNYKSGPSTAEGLEPKKSDAAGGVSWTWQIGGRTTLGTYSAVVSGGGDSFDVSFEVVD